MILPIFLTNQFLCVKSKDGEVDVKLINLRPVDDVFSPYISTARIRELLKDLLDENTKPVILSIADDNLDIEPEYDFANIVSSVSFPIIVPEYYYTKALDIMTPGAVNTFLTCAKYGIEIPEDIKIQLDEIAISLYVKDNIGKFISQNQIVISTANIDPKFKGEYTEAVLKALSDNVQIAGVWNVFIDFDYSLFPNLIASNEAEAEAAQFFDSFLDASHGKLIIAPGVTEVEVGEGDNFETIQLSAEKLNKFKVKEDDKVTFKWKSDKSKFDGEVFGSKTGIRIDVRERLKT